MAPTNTGEDTGPVLSLKDALCMVSNCRLFVAFLLQLK